MSLDAQGRTGFLRTVAGTRSWLPPRWRVASLADRNLPRHRRGTERWLFMPQGIVVCLRAPTDKWAVQTACAFLMAGRCHFAAHAGARQTKVCCRCRRVTLGSRSSDSGPALFCLSYLRLRAPFFHGRADHFPWRCTVRWRSLPSEAGLICHGWTRGAAVAFAGRPSVQAPVVASVCAIHGLVVPASRGSMHFRRAQF